MKMYKSVKYVEGKDGKVLEKYPVEQLCALASHNHHYC